METIEVVTRYGTMHLARKPVWFSPYAARGRHFTLCMGTSSWMAEEWVSHNDHPLLTREQISALKMECSTCKKLS